MRLDHCKSCRQSIWWARTGNGKAIPIDTTPAADGNVTLERTRGGDLIATVHGPLTLATVPLTVKRWQSHFRSCPNSKEHRRKSA